MSSVTSLIKVSKVTRIKRPGVGFVYRAIVPIDLLYSLLKRSVLRYSPKYQRGFARKRQEQASEADYDQLFPISDPAPQIDPKRAGEMAVKYLMGAVGAQKKLFASDVIWNARKDPDHPEGGVVYDDENQTLEIYTDVTIPDSAHRHLLYFLLGRWKEHPEQVPREVVVDQVPIPGERIKKWLEQVDFSDEDQYSVYVDIYNLDPIEEGWLYDEFNADAKRPSRAKELDLNQQKTPTRRFVYRLIETCGIFGREEVETQTTTIGSKSRKLTTNATMEAAIRPFQKALVKLEQTATKYDDLIDFFCAFYDEWANHYPEFTPGANAEDRQALRKGTFALSNIMFFPMFRLTFELWQAYEKNKVDWRTQNDWKEGLARLAGKTTETDPDSGSAVTASVMDRDNPVWKTSILVPRFDRDGSRIGWIVSSTRDTRNAAYAYLRDKARIGRLGK